MTGGVDATLLAGRMRRRTPCPWHSPRATPPHHLLLSVCPSYAALADFLSVPVTGHGCAGIRSVKCVQNIPFFVAGTSFSPYLYQELAVTAIIADTMTPAHAQPNPLQARGARVSSINTMPGLTRTALLGEIAAQHAWEISQRSRTFHDKSFTLFGQYCLVCVAVWPTC